MAFNPILNTTKAVAAGCLAELLPRPHLSQPLRIPTLENQLEVCLQYRGDVQSNKAGQRDKIEAAAELHVNSLVSTVGALRLR